MANHRMKVADAVVSHHSFSQQSSTQNNHKPKYRKKGAIYPQPLGCDIYSRIKTDQREAALVHPHIKSLHQGHSSFSTHKLSKVKNSFKVEVDRKPRKNKHTISVINISRNAEDSRIPRIQARTKRKTSGVDLGDKIKEKIDAFRIIANCLQQYTREERRHHSQVEISDILKIIGAFTRSEIAPISKPLEQLINGIIASINSSLTPTTLPSYQSPEKGKSQQVKDTVKKKKESRQYKMYQEQEQYPGDVCKLEENLDRLKYQSNRLKYFLEEVTAGKQLKRAEKLDKCDQLRELQRIAENQVRTINELENSGHVTFNNSPF